MKIEIHLFTTYSELVSFGEFAFSESCAKDDFYVLRGVLLRHKRVLIPYTQRVLRIIFLDDDAHVLLLFLHIYQFCMLNHKPELASLQFILRLLHKLVLLLLVQ